MSDQLIEITQSMISKGAAVKIGVRVVHVVLSDDRFRSTLRMSMSRWREIRPSLKVRVRNMQKGLKP